MVKCDEKLLEWTEGIDSIRFWKQNTIGHQVTGCHEKLPSLAFDMPQLSQFAGRYLFSSSASIAWIHRAILQLSALNIVLNSFQTQGRETMV